MKSSRSGELTEENELQDCNVARLRDQKFLVAKFQGREVAMSKLERFRG